MKAGTPIIPTYQRPPTRWTRHAACAGMDPDIFYPTRGGNVSAAKAVCRRCPVIISCREWAITNREKFGVWGGLGERQRAELRRARRRAS